MNDSGSIVPPHRYHILNLEPEGYSGEARAVLSRVGEISDGPLGRRELLERISAYDVLIVRLQHQIDREAFEAGKNLKAIVSATTGLDHIDLQAAASRNVPVLSLKGEQAFLSSITATAEHTWGLLLALMRRIPEAIEAVRDGSWNRDALKGRDLAGKRLGIVGLGRLGRQVASYGSAFGMRVAAYDPFLDEWPGTVVRAASLVGLAAESDVLTVHVNLHAGAMKLIGQPELDALPRGSVLVNTSRGQILDEEALLNALVSGQLGGAALDVLADERCPETRTKNPLLTYAQQHRNLLITPHIGGATHEAMCRTEVFMAHKLTHFLQHMPA
jgi:D-3-phosphoglycerate dehydrogenase